MSKYRSLFLGLFLITGCSLLGTERVGDAPETLRVNAIKAGTHTKDDVARLLGTPTSITLFEKESWLYIESEEQNRLFLPQQEIDREVIQITFKKNDVVERVKKWTLEDGKDIAFDSEATPVVGKDLSVIDEIVGNFGKFPANNRGGDR